MLYRLKMWREQDKRQQDPHLDTMIMILCYPEQFVPLYPDSFKTAFIAERYEALLRIQKQYSKCPRKLPVEPSHWSGDSHRDFGNYPLPPERDWAENGAEIVSAPLKLQFDAQEKRWRQLQEWKKLLVFSDRHVTPARLDFTYREDLLTPAERIFEDPLKSDLLSFQEDYEAGKEQYESMKLATLPPQHVKRLQMEVQAALESATRERRETEATLLGLINVRHPVRLQQELARIGGKQETLIGLQDCVNALLSGDARQFWLKNRNLTRPQVDEAATLTLRWVDLKSYEAQLKKIAGCAETSAAKLAELLENVYHFDKFGEKEQVVLRVFSGQSGNIPYKVQTDLILKMLETDEKGRYKEKVVQHIMGGGKTAILATLLLYLAAKRHGRMAFFIVPPSQFLTFSANFGEAMGKAFGKETLSLNLERKDFTLYKLKQIHELLEKARKEDLPLILSAMTLQMLDLEEKSLSRKIRTKIARGEYVYSDLKEKCSLIAKILTLSANFADVLIDEVDQILDCYQEVTFVDGERTPVDPMRNLLLLTLHKGMLKQELIGIDKNQQSLMTPSVYLEQVVPHLAQYVTAHFKPISTQIQTYEEAFLRYVSNKIPHVLQRFADHPELLVRKELPKFPELAGYKTLHQDIAFLRHLKRLHQGKKHQAEAADLIALTKHYLQEVAKSTLSKIGGRNYAPNPKQPDEIIPYEGNNAPKTSKFGYHWELAAFHYQWGSASKPNPEQILRVAESYKSSAEYYMDRNVEKFEETAEFLEFQETFGVRLDQIHHPGEMEKAITWVSKDPEKLLEMQYEAVDRYASFASERLSNDGFTLLDLVDSTRTMSGTPWNVDGYKQELVEGFLPSVGTEGRIAHASMQKGIEIYELDFSSMPQFLGELLAVHKDFFNIRTLTDPAGEFKNFGSNANVAKEWLSFIEKKQALLDTRVDPKIEAVLFFHTDPDELQPNTLYAYRKGAQEPERIGSSTPEALKAKGLTPDKYLVLIDERHKDATDILMLPNVRGPITVDEKMLLRSDSQAIMRLRQYLAGQNCDLLVNKKTRKSFYRAGASVQDVRINEARAQSLRKTSSMVRYFSRQIHHIFRGIADREIRKANLRGFFDASYANLVTCYEKFFTDFYQEKPYLQHGQLSQIVNTKRDLQDQLQLKLEKFKVAVKDPGLIVEATKKAARLRDWIEASRSLPTEWERGNSPLGIEQFVEQQVEVQKETEVEVEKEIEIELLGYEGASKESIASESTMPFDQFKQLVLELQSEPKELIPLQKQLSDYKYSAPYHEIFKQQIYGTSAFFYTCSNRELLSIFHPLQRPAKQLLVVETHLGFRWLMLSEHETKDAKTHLEALYSDPQFGKVWLIQPDGSLFVKSEEVFPLEHDAILDGLTEINALNGHFSFLDAKKNEESSERWLSSQSELKVRYLKLRTFRKKPQQQLLQSSALVAAALDKERGQTSHQTFHMCKKRLEWERTQKQGRFRPAQEWETKILDNRKQIRNLNALYVPLLGFDSEATDVHTQTALKHFKGLSPEELKQKAKQLTELQFDALGEIQGPFVTPEQICWLPPKNVRYLTSGAQIRTEKYLLTREQVAGLVETQGHLIPSVNPDFYRDFDQNWQIQNIPLELLTRMNPKIGGLLSQRQIEAITVQQVQSNVVFFKVLFKQFSPMQVQWLQGDLIDYLPSDQLIHIQPEQIESITNRSLIPQLEKIAAKCNEIEEGTWSSWVTPLMVPQLAHDQLPFLKTKEQIAEVADGDVPRLSPKTQVPFIARVQARLLEGQEQVQACPNEHVPGLREDQIASIQPSQAAYLKEPKYIQTVMKSEPYFVALTPHQMAHVGDEQLQWVTKDQVKGLSNRQLLELKKRHPEWQERMKELSDAQIALFDSLELVALIPKGLVTKITEKQLPFLSEEWQFKECPTPLVPKLPKNKISFIEGKEAVEALPASKENVEQLQKRHFRFLKKEHVPFLTPAQIKQMDDPDEVKWFEQEQFHQLGSSQVNLLPETAIPHIRNREQIQALTDPKRFACLVADSTPWSGGFNPMAHIADEQLKYVTEAQVKGLNGDQLVKLKTAQPANWEALRQKITLGQFQRYLDTVPLAALLPASLIKKYFYESRLFFLIEPWQIQACPEPLIEKLSDAQIQHLAPEQVKLLAESQVKALPERAELVQELEKRHLPHITDVQANLLAPNQIQLLEKQVLISKLGEAALQHLTLQQIPLIIPAQVQHIKDGPKVGAIPALKEYVEQFVKLQFRHIADQHVRWLTPAQIKLMDCVEEISKLSSDKIQHLEPGQLQRVAESQVKGLSQGQLLILKDQHPHWKKLFEHLVEAQLPFLTEQWQVQTCPEPLIEKLGGAQLNLLTPQQIQKLKNQQTISKLDDVALQHLSLQQIPLITPAQVRSIVDEIKVGAIPATKEHVEQLVKPQLRSMAGPQVKLLTPAQIKLMDTSEELALLGSDQVREVNPIAVNVLNANQVQHLKSWEQIQGVQNQALFASLTADQMPHIAAQQLPWVTEAQVKGLSKQQLLELKEKHTRWNELMRHLSQPQVAHFDSKELVNLIPADLLNSLLSEKQVPYLAEQWQIQALSSALLRHISYKQAEWLISDQIKLLDSRKAIEKLSQSQWLLLGEKGIACLRAEEIVQLQAKPEFLDKVPYIKPDLLQVVTDARAVAKIKDAQVDAFGSPGFNKLDKKHPLWKKITPGAIQSLNPDRIPLLAKEQLKFVKKREALRSISLGNIVYLTKQQLVARKKFHLTYIIGVLTLGVVACVASLVAYSLFPLIALFSRKKGKQYRANLNAPFKRVGHLFSFYIPAAVAA